MDRTRGHLSKDIKGLVSSLIWVKVVCVGDTGCGKTCFIKHFCEKKFSNSYYPTVGVDYGFKIQQVDGIDVRVHLWDLAGGAEYLEVRKDLYVNSDIVLLLIDLTQPSSLHRASVWLSEIENFGPNPRPLIALIGNKVDLKAQRAISIDDASKWSHNHEMPYYEVSCATGIGLEVIFIDLLTNVLRQIKKIKQ